MALTLDADPNSATFNCFITLADAELYHEARLFNTNWTGATTGNKEAALVWATRQLGTLKWRGVRTVGTQNLELPRKGLSYTEYSDSFGSDYEDHDIEFGYRTVVEIDSATIPDAVKDATAELALYMLESDITAPDDTSGFSEIKVDTIQLKINPKDRKSWFNPSVRNLIWRFLANTSAFNAPTQRVG